MAERIRFRNLLKNQLWNLKASHFEQKPGTLLTTTLVANETNNYLIDLYCSSAIPQYHPIPSPVPVFGISERKGLKMDLPSVAHLDVFSQGHGCASLLPAFVVAALVRRSTCNLKRPLSCNVLQLLTWQYMAMTFRWLLHALLGLKMLEVILEHFRKTFCLSFATSTLRPQLAKTVIWANLSIALSGAEVLHKESEHCKECHYF